ncbi:MAG: sigma-54 dependent transcriptional regulator [Syntrophales bacterium]|nr:sigma-54 dependent transcriptional regulator [Syntrophales bacterium]
MHSILVVDDEEDIRQALKMIFDSESYQSFFSSNGKEAIEIIRKKEIDLMLLDLRLPDIGGLEVLKTAKAIDPLLTVIIMTGYADVETAVQAMKTGAYDYIKKPLKADAIKLVTRLVFETQILRREINHLRSKDGHNGDPFEFILVSQQLKNIFGKLKEVVKYSHIPILIQGETGTGKNVIARVIHNMKGGPFIELNCAAIPESLLESELFGYERGAFTGAEQGKAGLFELAGNGTLFLNEIGSMPLGLQPKILHVLDDMRLRRLGGKKDISVKAQVLVATNRDLEIEVQQGRFRKDLFFRLNVFPIVLPSLRERKYSILKLAQHFIMKHSWRFHQQPAKISPEVAAVLQNYSWPGNVRELENIINRILISNPDLMTILPCHLPAEILTDTPPWASPLSQADQGFCGDSKDRLSEFMIKKALEKAGGNISKAARMLGVARSTLAYRIGKLTLRKGD